MSGPPDLSIQEAAIAMHETFTSLLGAGFTERQALYVVAQMTKPCNCGGGA